MEDKGKAKDKKAARGDKYSCSLCGMTVTVDEICGCTEVCDIICCGKQMELKNK
jgi:hypothetical protein